MATDTRKTVVVLVLSLLSLAVYSVGLTYTVKYIIKTEAKPAVQTPVELQLEQLEIERQRLELERQKLISSCKAGITPSKELHENYFAELECESRYKA